ncbi:hypothetical protein RRG08_032577 [Elysia crispata]|uniref:Uncharacterized protein n=1 Tax=Elysia crispata TaxID=231223 RepID=A0AAE0ZXG5_9GAST|nr:hypothetical protein RRG08_032577 [Elysia crispata]
MAEYNRPKDESLSESSGAGTARESGMKGANCLTSGGGSTISDRSVPIAVYWQYAQRQPQLKVVLMNQNTKAIRGLLEKDFATLESGVHPLDPQGPPPRS